MRMTNKIFLLFLLTVISLTGCVEPFTSAGQIQSQRFLGISADPLETAPGSSITFHALVTNEDGSPYDGPIAWAIVSSTDDSNPENVNPNDFYVQMPDSPPFTWQVPNEAEIRKRFGGIEENGVLLSVSAAAFKNGDLNSDPLIALKLFVVSLRPEENRMTNVALNEIKVSDSTGMLTPDSKGIFHTSGGKVMMHAIADEDNDDITYHWFSTLKDFAPELEDVQKLDPKQKGKKSVYCVLHRSYWFIHDDDTKTRVTGIDWQHVEIKFE